MLCEAYTCTMYLVTCTYISKFVSNFANILAIVKSHNCANEVSTCFKMHETHDIVEKCVYKRSSNLASLCIYAE